MIKMLFTAALAAAIALGQSYPAKAPAVDTKSKTEATAKKAATKADANAADTKAKAAEVKTKAADAKAPAVPGKELKEMKAPAAALPTAKEIEAAQKSGLVWVNLDSKIFHKEGQFYGTTKNGKFMTEAEAVRMGARAGKQGAVSTDPKATVKK